MSARRAALRLSPEADRDLDDLLLYTRRTWGAQQMAVYRTAIYRTLRMIRDHPNFGQPRDEICLSCRSVQVRQHVIYYHQPQAIEIVVLRVLHRRQDASALVRDPHSPDPGGER